MGEWDRRWWLRLPIVTGVARTARRILFGAQVEPNAPRPRHRGTPAPQSAEPNLAEHAFFQRPDPALPQLRPLLAAGARIVDLGCGTARHRQALREQGLRWMGFDRSARGETGSGGDRCRADLFTLPLRDESVDAVLAWQVLCQFGPEQVEAALAEITRILSPRGLLVLCGCYAPSHWPERELPTLPGPFVPIDSRILGRVPGWSRLRWLVIARKSEVKK